MKNFFAFINAGHNSFNSGQFGDAVSHYKEARNIAARTNDRILRKVYLNYGIKAQLDEWYNNAYAQYKLQNPSKPAESSGSVSVSPAEVSILPRAQAEVPPPRQRPYAVCAAEPAVR